MKHNLFRKNFTNRTAQYLKVILFFKENTFYIECYKISQLENTDTFVYFSE